MLANVCARICVYACGGYCDFIFYYFIEISYTTDDEHDVSISFARPFSFSPTYSINQFIWLLTVFVPDHSKSNDTQTVPCGCVHVNAYVLLFTRMCVIVYFYLHRFKDWNLSFKYAFNYCWGAKFWFFFQMNDCTFHSEINVWIEFKIFECCLWEKLRQTNWIRNLSLLLISNIQFPSIIYRFIEFYFSAKNLKILFCLQSDPPSNW